jgi:peptide/nickel transport system substrate-binding protein
MGMMLRACFAIAIAALCANGDSSELRWAMRADPTTFDPLLASDEPSETVRYLTGGVLLRFNRITQQLEPELAKSWKTSSGGKRIDFVLRDQVKFSDGSPFSARDVVSTIKRLMDPALQSAIADTFRGGGATIRAEASGANSVAVLFSQPVAGVEFLFDQLAITRDGAARDSRTGLGPFTVAEHRSGQYVLLRRNPNYWKKDAKGVRLPYADSIRLDIQANREAELLRFRRGELHFIQGIDPDSFDRLRKDMPRAPVDSGPSLASEFLWFNQAPDAPIPQHKRAWFQSRGFRAAISTAIERADMVRLVYRGHATFTAGPVSPSNKIWFNRNLKPAPYDPKHAIELLQQDGFRRDGSVLKDRSGNAIEFSVVTNAGSKTRAQLGSIIQQDLSKLGIKVNLVPLEFRSLLERIQKTNNYDACLLGLSNIELDPNAQMNVWISSGTHHPWNPEQKTPATPWESEIDKRMREQAAATDRRVRKRAYDRVQEIIAEQVPIIYLVHPNVLSAVSPLLRNVSASVLPPHVFWNVEWLSVDKPER